MASLSTVKSAVAHDIDSVGALVDRAVDVLWPSRYDTKSWDSLPSESVGITDDSTTIEAKSRAVYQRLVFDMTAQTVTTLCDDTTTVAVSDAPQPWRQRQTIVNRPVPQSSDEAKPLIRASVLKQLGLESHRPPLVLRYLGQVRGRRHADQVDEVLGAELVEEESAWTDYTNDELFVKMQVTDMLFDMIVSDTVNTLSGVIARKRQRCQ